jgi:carboxyl-terminal processing protease
MSLDADVHRIILESRSELDDFVWRSRQLGDILLWQLNAFELKGRDLTAPLRSAKDARAVVLDLRGNGGGALTSLVELIAAFVDHKVLVAVTRGREGTDSVWALPAKNPFMGRLVVLIDGRSGSAAEIFARVMQLEARATVLGDWSMGAVLGSNSLSRGTGVGRMVFFGISMTVLDVRMADGASLEHKGVMPDEIVLPTGADLAAGRDPALARAVEIAGGRIDPKLAGTVFPVIWAK